MLRPAGDRFLEEHGIIARPIPLGSIPNPAIHPQGRGGPVRRPLPATLVVEKFVCRQPYRRGHPGQAPSRRGSRSSSNRADTWPQSLIPSREGQVPREGLFVAPECHMTILAPSQPRRNIDRDGSSIALGRSRFAKYLLLYSFPSIVVHLFLQSLPPWRRIDTSPPRTPLQTQPSQRPLRGRLSSLDKPKPHSRLRSIMNLVNVPSMRFGHTSNRGKKKETNQDRREDAPNCACRHWFPHSLGRQSKIGFYRP